MRDAKKKRLRDAWHGPLTAEQIARAAAVGEKWLRRFWVQEKQAGRLPEGPRPHFVERSVRADAAEVILDDDSPIGEPNRTHERECDAMRAALIAHHVGHPAAHTAPDSWLRFDAKGMPTPTHLLLMRMCRAHDQHHHT